MTVWWPQNDDWQLTTDAHFLTTSDDMSTSCNTKYYPWANIWQNFKILPGCMSCGLAYAHPLINFLTRWVSNSILVDCIEIWQILLRFWQVCIKNWLCNKVEFLQQRKMVCYFGSSIDAFIRYGEIWLFWPKLECEIDLIKNSWVMRTVWLLLFTKNHWFRFWVRFRLDLVGLNICFLGFWAKTNL